MSTAALQRQEMTEVPDEGARLECRQWKTIGEVGEVAERMDAHRKAREAAVAKERIFLGCLTLVEQRRL